MNIDEIRTICDTILKEDKDIILQIPLKDLIWTIICYSEDMSNLEKEAFTEYPFYPSNKSEEEVDDMIQQREYKACRRDELARLISQYSTFNTQKIWTETGKLFKNWYTGGLK